MGWRDRYQRASFRGVAFYCRRDDLESGRRTQLHVYPGKDTPYSEDLGRRPRLYGVEGYVLGDDYDLDLQDLLRALETPGPGRLMHPLYGELLVACTRVRVSNTDTELRMATLTMDFEESGESLEPSITTNTAAVVDTKKKAALSKITDAFLKGYSLARAPFAAVNKIRNAVEAGLDLVDTARRAVADAADYQRELATLGGLLPGLVTDPDALVNGFMEVLTFGTYPSDGLVRTADINTKTAFDDLLVLFTFAPETDTDPTSPTEVFNTMVQSAAIVTAGGLIPEISWDSLEAAQESADKVLEAMDGLVDAGSVDDDVAASMQDLRVAIMADLEERSDSLSRLGEVTLSEALPALVLSYDLYGALDQEESILLRNGIDHPGFVPAATPVEVLINV